VPWLLEVTLIVASLLFIIDIYLGWRLVSSARSLTYRFATFLTVAVILFLAGFFTFPLSGLVAWLTRGAFDFYGFPIPFVYFFWYGLAFSVQLVLWVVLLDFIKFIVKILLKFDSPLVDLAHAVFVAGIASVLVFTTAIKLYEDTNAVDVNRVEYRSASIPSDLNGFRIAHISDIQVDKFTGKKQVERYIDSVNAQQADLVVFTGDLVTHGTEYIDRGARWLGRARARYGTVAVIGDHDYWASKQKVAAALQKQGIKVLEGTNLWLDTSGKPTVVSGVTNVYSEKVSPETVNEVTSSVDSAAVRILATHQVSDLLVGAAREHEYDLILAGHTHGGQLRFDILGFQICASMLETPYISGSYPKGNLLINVNNGLGFTLAPVRYNARADVSIITLRQP